MNTTKILQKCVVELQKEAPDLAYIRGILETLIEMDGVVVPAVVATSIGPRFQMTTGKDLLGKTDETTDEEKEYAHKMAGPIGNLHD